MKKIIHIITLLIFLFSTSNTFAISANINNPTFISTKTQSVEEKDVYMKYTVANGLSMSSSTLTIKQNGDVILETLSARPKLVTKTKKITLTKNQFINFKSIVNNAKLFSLKDSYKCEKLCPTDMSTTSIKFNYYEKTKNISMYAPVNLPKELSKVLSNLRAIQIKTSLNGK